VLDETADKQSGFHRANRVGPAILHVVSRPSPASDKNAYLAGCQKRLNFGPVLGRPPWRGARVVGGWKRPFADPIPLPGGRQLVTLEDAAGYIMKLPKAEQNLGEWQAAIECLILVAEKNGPTMMARMCASSIRMAKTAIGESGS
jgi:hypothetical protein